MGVVHIDNVPALNNGVRGSNHVSDRVSDHVSETKPEPKQTEQPFFGKPPHKKNDSVVSDNGTHYISYSGTHDETPKTKKPQDDKLAIADIADIDINAITALHNK